MPFSKCFVTTLATVFSSAATANAEILSADGIFTIVESDTAYSISLSTGGSSTKHPEITGRIGATITFDTETLRPETFKLRGRGVIEWEDFDFRIDSNIRFDGIGTVPATLVVGFQNIGSEIPRIRGNVRIDPITGDLNTEDFRLVSNQGIGIAGIEIDGILESDTIDYSDAPQDFDLSSNPTLSIERIQDDIYGFRYDFSIEFANKDSQFDNVPGTNLRMTISEDFRVVAQFSYAEESEWGYWYRNNRYHYDGTDFDSLSSSGIPMYLAFALGHDHDNPDHRMPFTFTTYDGDTHFTVISRQRRANVAILYNTHLGTENWQPVPAEWITDGTDALRNLSRHDIQVKLPKDSTPLFFKVAATPPALP